MFETPRLLNEQPSSDTFSTLLPLSYRSCALVFRAEQVAEGMGAGTCTGKPSVTPTALRSRTDQEYEGMRVLAKLPHGRVLVATAAAHAFLLDK